MQGAGIYFSGVFFVLYEIDMPHILWGKGGANEY